MLPLVIFLPRNSYDQALSGKPTDLSAYTPDDRLNYLMTHGKPFTTLVYIKGHVMLYIGKTNWQGRQVPMTYQNLRGLRPAGSPSRSIIGQALFFPLLVTYQEDTELTSPAHKPLFIMSALNRSS